MPVKLLGVSGSLRESAYTLRLVQIALEAARIAGAEVELLDLRDHPLPMYEAHEDYDEHQVVKRVIRKVEEADGYIVGSPEYHGCMTGATKNFFDFLYREICGKLFGLVSATGGSQGNGCFDNMRAAIQYCHGWALPYNVAATGRDFDAQGNLTNEKVQDRLQRMGRDMTIYAPLLFGRFNADLSEKSPAQPGFAHWMA
ncbi:MAG: NADPH-dependent FMN reductase [Candidatus Sumerlaeaceae bacterium]